MAARGAAVRQDDWRALPRPFEADPARASVAFRRLLTEADARRLLGAAGARPYVARAQVGGQSGEHRLPDTQASLDALAVARREVVAALSGPPGVSRGLGDRARSVVRDYTPEQLAADPEKLRYARALVGSVEEGEKRAAEARADGPFLYGVDSWARRERSAVFALPRWFGKYGRAIGSVDARSHRSRSTSGRSLPRPPCRASSMP